MNPARFFLSRQSYLDQIALAGHAQVPEISLVEKAFEFGGVTCGGSESLDVNLVNRGSIPASLYLDLSDYPEFHLKWESVSGAQPQLVGGGRGEEGLRGAKDERFERFGCVKGCYIIPAAVAIQRLC